MKTWCGTDSDGRTWPTILGWIRCIVRPWFWPEWVRIRRRCKKDYVGKGVCGGCLEMRDVFLNPTGGVARCYECLRRSHGSAHH